MTTPETPDRMTPEEERRALLLEEGVPPLLARALDRAPELWDVLWSQRELRRAREDGQDPEALEKALEALPEGNSAARPLRLQVTRIRTHLSYLESLGLGFDFRKGAITIPTPGRPRLILRPLVEALHEEIRAERGRIPRREELALLARLLAPFLPPEWTTTDSRGLLARTLDNV